MRESPDGRLFVNDLRGQLYQLDGQNPPQLYLDIDADNGGPGSILPNASFSGGLSAGLNSFAFHPAFDTNGLFYTLHMERLRIRRKRRTSARSTCGPVRIRCFGTRF